MPPRPPHAENPVSIEGYDVYERIGAGGFSIVYRARQQSMGREVAVKVLNFGFATEDEQKQFVRECHALGRLSHHPNIVTVFSDAMTADGRPCLVMELYDQTYRERIKEMTQLPIGEVLSVGIRICGALQAAHDAGVLHRDLKPHNIFLSAYGEPALGDFGISTIDDERSQTGAGSLSIAYAAPEILEDGRPTAVADVYSLAATLFQMTEGASPFASTDMKTAVRKILTESPPPLRHPEAPHGLQRVLHRALSKDPSSRPQTAIEFAEALREVQARAGQAHTAIPRISLSEPPLPTLASPTRTDPSPVPADESRAVDAAGTTDASSRARPSATIDDGDSGTGAGSVTIARSQPASSKRSEPREPADEADRQPPWRRFVGPGALVALLVLGGVGVVALRGSDDEADPEPAVASTSIPDDPIFEDVPPPGEVSVTAVTGGFEVAFEASAAATTTEIELLDAGAPGRTVDADGSPTLIETDASTLCVQLRSFGERGRVSQTVGPVCST